MKKVVRFSRFFLPAAILSVIITSAGITSYFVMGGFNLGVDFQAGVIQEVQFAPTAFSITWSGRGNASIAFDRSGLYIVNSGIGIESRTLTFLFSEYGTVGTLAEALMSSDEGLNVALDVPPQVSTQWLVRSAQGTPQLGSVPYLVHYLDPNSQEIPIATVREALANLGQAVAVQSLGQPSDRHFMIRLEDKPVKAEIAQDAENVQSTDIQYVETEDAESIDIQYTEAEDVEGTDIQYADAEDVEGAPVANVAPASGSPAERITNVLAENFGSNEVVVLRSDYVGSRFSKNLTDQAGILIAVTLLLILIYSSIRFKPQYAVGAVIGIVHDALVIVSFVVWTRMEFNTSTIAAILTILGYSINNTIVIFDRIRENRRIYPNELFVEVLNRSLTETLGRTVITTLTTMLAVLSLFIFTTGTMKDFALALQVGMLSGVYTTMFIACGFVNFWENQKIKKAKKQKQGIPAKGTAVKA
jgi:preprotein translocase subunit SecF